MTWVREDTPSTRNQYYATIVANMVAFSYGLGLGWSSPNVPILLSSESPLSTGPVSLNDSTWISSLFCIGGAVGALAYGLIVDVVGRKWSLLLLGIPQAISWALIAFVMNVQALMVARFLIGFSAGGMFLIIPLFVTEISNANIRGVLGNVMGLNICLGTFLAFILSHYFSYKIMPIVSLVMILSFFIIILWFPDSPQSLLLRKQTAQAERSQTFYKRMDTIESNPENKLKPVQQSDDSGKITFAELMVPTNRKGILLGFGTVAMTQFCGSFAILNYTATIFRDAGSTMHPNVCAMVIGFIQLAAVTIIIFLIDRVGRKILLLASSASTAAFHMVLGMYFFYQSRGYDMSEWSWLPLGCLSGLMFVVIGIATVPFLVTVELLPPKLRSSVPSVFMLIVWLMAFVFVRYFNTMVDVLAMHGCLWFFGAFCIFEFVFVAIWLPETKGKDYEQIRKEL